MIPAAKLRWSFSLRTLFVAVTLFACWLTYELNWIRQRHAFLNRHQELFQSMHKWEWAKRVAVKNTSQQVSVPWSLRLFGESGQQTLVLIVPTGRQRDELSAEESNAVIAQEDKAARRLFPEAQITVSIDWCADDEPELIDR